MRKETVIIGLLKVSPRPLLFMRCRFNFTPALPEIGWLVKAVILVPKEVPINVDYPGMVHSRSKMAEAIKHPPFKLAGYRPRHYFDSSLSILGIFADVSIRSMTSA